MWRSQLTLQQQGTVLSAEKAMLFESIVDRIGLRPRQVPIARLWRSPAAVSVLWPDPAEPVLCHARFSEILVGNGEEL